MEENFEEKLNNIDDQIEETKVEIIEETKCDDTVREPEEKSSGRKVCSNNVKHWIVEGVLLLAIVVLYILHFCCGGKQAKTVATPVLTDTGSGEFVYINIDTINAQYELVHILTDSIDVEKQKQAVVFQNRQKSLEQKAANFQRNYSSGSLTPQQAQYAQQSLEEESTRLQSDYAQALESLEIRYQTALQQIADSLNAAANRVNANRNASYIFTYQNGGALLYASPSQDITNDVLDELNKSFKKKK